MRTAAVTIMTAFCIFSISLAQVSVETREARVDKLFEPWNKPGIPGAAAAVVQDGKPLLVKGYGCADLEHSMPITPQTVFNVASLAKQFTAFSILLLQARGRLLLDADVRTYVPEFPNFGRTITLRHLLYHTSGLRDWGGLILMTGGRMDDVFTSSALLKLISRQRELHFEPGTEYAYSNAGYIILAEIVSRVAGQSFKEWTRANVFAPLGMESAVFRDDVGELIRGAAESYQSAGESQFLRALDNEAAPGPGSLFLSLEDMARWLAAFQTQAIGGPETWTKMFERGRLADGRALPYAAGLICSRYKELTIFHHSGRWAGFRGETVYFPEQHLGVAVLTNNSAIDPTQLSRRISDIYLEGRFPAPEPPPPPVEVDGSILDAYAGRYWLRGEQTIVVKRMEKDLFAQIDRDPPLKLYAEAVDMFSFRRADVKIQFHRSGSGKAHKLIFWQGALALPAERIPEETWSPRDPEEFCGQYLSDELGVVLEVTRTDKGLSVPFIRRSDLLLVPIATDMFAGKDSSVKFQFIRGSEGKVTELRFSTLDSWKVRFRRLGKSQF